MARLSLSVAPEVKTISCGRGADGSSDLAAGLLHCAAASQPKEWLLLAALPKRDGEEGQHGFQHARVERRGGMVIQINRKLNCAGRNAVAAHLDDDFTKKRQQFDLREK